MGIIDYSKLIRKTGIGLVWCLFYIILALMIILNSKDLHSFWKVLLIIIMIYHIIDFYNKIVDLNEYIRLKKVEEDKTKNYKSSKSHYDSYDSDDYYYGSYEKSYDEQKRKYEEELKRDKQRKQKSYSQHSSDDYYKQAEDAYKERFRQMYEEFERTRKSNSQRNKQNSYNQQKQNDYKQQSSSRPKTSTDKLSDAYKLMGLKNTDDVSKIKGKFRELAKKWHPDVFATDTKENQDIANRNFQKLNAAYELIKNDRNIN